MNVDILGAGWEDAGEMLINGNADGGIIDRNPTLNKWFVIFNDDRDLGDTWFDTRDEAITAFVGN